MADGDRRNMGWGTAIVAALFITFALIVIFGIGPSQFITTVNKSYGKVPDSRQSRFQRDLVSGLYHMIIVGWLAVGAYQLQRLGTRARRVIASVVLLGLPCIAFALVPAIVHAFVNAWVSSKPIEQQPQALYDGDLWVYTGYWVLAIGAFALATPGWIFGLKKIEERFSPEGRAARRSAFGRPIVTPS